MKRLLLAAASALFASTTFANIALDTGVGVSFSINQDPSFFSSFSITPTYSQGYVGNYPTGTLKTFLDGYTIDGWLDLTSQTPDSIVISANFTQTAAKNINAFLECGHSSYCFPSAPVPTLADTSLGSVSLTSSIAGSIIFSKPQVSVDVLQNDGTAFRSDKLIDSNGSVGLAGYQPTGNTDLAQSATFVVSPSALIGGHGLATSPDPTCASFDCMIPTVGQGKLHIQLLIPVPEPQQHALILLSGLVIAFVAFRKSHLG